MRTDALLIYDRGDMRVIVGVLHNVTDLDDTLRCACQRLRLNPARAMLLPAPRPGPAARRAFPT